MADEKEYLSLAELAEMQDGELENFNPDADANALPPPMQPGKYLVKVRHQEDEEEKLWVNTKTKANKKRKTTGGVPYFITNLICEVVDNPANPKEYVGRRIIANNVMTLVMSNGTTGAQAVIQAMGGGSELANGPQKASRQCVILSRLISEEILVGVELDWEASWYSKEKEEDLHDRVRGYKKFKKDEEGKYIPEYVIDGDEGEVRPFVRRWLKAAELTGGKQGADTGDVVEEVEEPVKSAPLPPPAPKPRPKK